MSRSLDETISRLKEQLLFESYDTHFVNKEEQGLDVKVNSLLETPQSILDATVDMDYFRKGDLVSSKTACKVIRNALGSELKVKPLGEGALGRVYLLSKKPDVDLVRRISTFFEEYSDPELNDHSMYSDTAVKVVLHDCKSSVETSYAEWKSMSNPRFVRTMRDMGVGSPTPYAFSVVPGSAVGCKGSIYTMTLMSKVEGLTLAKALEVGYYRTFEDLHKLSRDLEMIAASMLAEGFIHRDMLCRNIIVDPFTKMLSIIDYETMFVDNLSEVREGIQYHERHHMNDFIDRIGYGISPFYISEAIDLVLGLDTYVTERDVDKETRGDIAQDTSEETVELMLRGMFGDMDYRVSIVPDDRKGVFRYRFVGKVVEEMMRVFSGYDNCIVRTEHGCKDDGNYCMVVRTEDFYRGYTVHDTSSFIPDVYLLTQESTNNGRYTTVCIFEDPGGVSLGEISKGKAHLKRDAEVQKLSDMDCHVEPGVFRLKMVDGKRILALSDPSSLYGTREVHGEPSRKRTKIHHTDELLKKN